MHGAAFGDTAVGPGCNDDCVVGVEEKTSCVFIIVDYVLAH